MKNFYEVDLGYNDAANYRYQDRKSMFNAVFVKDDKLDRLMKSDTYYLIGDKGTGKTAYATYLENQEYKNTVSKIIQISETDYSIFIKLKKLNYLQLSDYTRVWKLILLTILAQAIDLKEIKGSFIKRNQLFKILQDNINNYYNYAFVPEVPNIFRYIQQETDAVNLGFTLVDPNVGISVNVADSLTNEKNYQAFQNNLLYLEKSFIEAFQKLKIEKNRFLFIDNVDIKPDDVAKSDYIYCLKGLSEAVWELNTTVFKSSKDSNGFCKIVLLIRPDILLKLNIHNLSNKIRDNGIFLDWRTANASYQKSSLFRMCERLLAYQNDLSESAWDTYFPWKTKDNEDSFLDFIRISLSRPRDMISILSALQDVCKKNERPVTAATDLNDYDCLNRISNYFIEEIKDWCLYSLSSEEFDTLLYFFSFLNGRSKFNYEFYLKCFNKYVEQVTNRKMPRFDEINDENNFLQLLFELNIIYYYDNIDPASREQSRIRFCYRERELHNLSPKVMLGAQYGIHFSMLKALNLGRN